MHSTGWTYSTETIKPALPNIVHKVMDYMNGLNSIQNQILIIRGGQLKREMGEKGWEMREKKVEKLKRKEKIDAIRLEMGD